MPPERKPEPHELRAGKSLEINFPCNIRLRRVKDGRRVIVDIEPLPQEVRRSIDKVSTSE